MSDRIGNRDDKFAPSIRARLLEISSTRYVRSLENLTEEELAIAERINTDAWCMRRNRIEGKGRRCTAWIGPYRLCEIFAWAMHPGFDVSADLLEQDTTNGAADRTRLPGVSIEDVQERIALVNEALVDRLRRS